MTREAVKVGIDNIKFEQGLAESLPFVDSCFDMVVSRLAIHHFSKPELPLAEMIRACRSQGKIVIFDHVYADDEGVFTIQNHLERLRDPSHTKGLSIVQFVRLIEKAGLELDSIYCRNVETSLETWLNHTNTSPEHRAIITEMLSKEIAGEGSKTGMRPFSAGENLKFLHTWALIIARVIK